MTDESWHGTTSGYAYRGCRCDACRANWARVNVAGRHLRATKRVPDHLHGTVNGYANYMCRCDACKAAWAKSVRDRRAARKEKS